MSKFNKEQKIEIYRKWKDEKISISQLSKAYKMNLANLDYMLRLIDMHGTNILNTRKRVYSKKFKEQTIEQAIFGTKSDVQLSLELGFKSISMLNNWLREYKENGYNVIIKQKGRPARGQRGSKIAQGTGEMKKVVKLISTISVGAVLVGSSILVTSQNSEAAYVSREATCTWKSAVITTGWFTLHGRGYSYPNSGKVSSAWITSGSALFNSIVNKSHWTYKTPRGVHLMGKATDKYAIGTQWAYIPITTDTQTVGVQF